MTPAPLSCGVETLYVGSRMEHAMAKQNAHVIALEEIAPQATLNT